MIDFTSDRKKMSVIVKDSDGRYINFIKGADEAIVPEVANKNHFEQACIKSLNEEAGRGMRTLMFAMKEL